MVNAEFAILDFIQNYLSSPIMDKVMVFITSLGNSGALWIGAALAMLCSRKYRHTGIMLAVGLILSMVVGNLILKPAVARLRPFQVMEGIELIIKPPHDFSFPSGHTLASVISAVIIFMQHRRLGVAAIITAVLIAFSRLYLYVHFPTDVLAGAILGVLIGIFSVKITKYFLKKILSI